MDTYNNGLKGDAGEPELVTRNKVRELAKHKLKIQGVNSHAFTACHRLSQREDAGVLCFQDLCNRNEWLLNAKNLKNSATNVNVSISPDIHPCLRKLRSNIMEKRKALPPQNRGNFHRFCIYLSGLSFA